MNFYQNVDNMEKLNLKERVTDDIYLQRFLDKIIGQLDDNGFFVEIVLYKNSAKLTIKDKVTDKLVGNKRVYLEENKVNKKETLVYLAISGFLNFGVECWVGVKNKRKGSLKKYTFLPLL